jgi:uncharacterized membrane-anchored protein
MKKDYYPILLIKEIIALLAIAIYLIKLDIIVVFYNLRVYPRDK